jgi:CheY-like chemotaxis protein
MGARVLVLDDQKYLREIIAAVLADAGYPALAVATADEARRCMNELHPEMLVLDVSLEGMTGLQFLDQLRTDPRWETLPVLVVSGDPAKLVPVKGRPHVGVLTKPFDVSVLLEEIQRVLGAPALTSTT